jgi:tetratricopeptide (TPR) repeat protein
MGRGRQGAGERTRTARLTADQAATLLGQAAAHRVAGRLDEAAGLYERVEAGRPDEVNAPYFLALIDLARERPAPALIRLLTLTRRLPDSAQAWTALAHARRALGQWREAAAASRRVLSLSPDAAAERLELAGALEVLGRIDEAVETLSVLTASGDHRLIALIHLARLRPGDIDARDEADIAAGAIDANLPPRPRAAAGFALGAILERRGHYDAAFAAFAAANRIRRDELTGAIAPSPAPLIGPKVSARDPAALEREEIERIGFLRAVFTPDFIARHAGRGHHLAAPIFIVGMPRSGSTLIEQILSSHPKVQGLGETGALIHTLEGQFPHALLAPETADHFRRLAQAYLAEMHARGWTSASRFVDKMLRNYMYLGAIHLMFPRAVILHARRDPADTCLANFRQDFATANETSYDLADIGRDYVRYREVMDHWAAVLPGRVIDVDHEALVADPEARIRWLVTKACGLDWNDACLRFHETRRAVRTASVAQVRQPIFTTSLRRWRRYEKHLGPLFEALGPYAPARAASDDAETG